MRIALTVLCCQVMVASAIAQPAHGANYAFLVACGEYREGQFKSLPYAYAETEDFRQALVGTGFEEKNITFLNDKRTEQGGRFLPRKDSILEEFDLLTGRLKKDDTLVVLFNGHGLHFKGEKASYFCPSNVKLDKKETMLPMDGEGGLYALLQKCKAGRKLLLVNACRNDPDPLNQAAAKDEFDNEAKENPPEGIAALFSCSPGQKCYYYPAEKKINRSLFMNHLIEAWQGAYSTGENVTMEDMFTNVKAKAFEDAAKLFGEKQFAVADRKYVGEWVIGETRLPKARLLVERAKKQREAKDYLTAVATASEAIKLVPDFVEAYAARALAYWWLDEKTKGRTDAAEVVKLCTLALSRDDKNARAYEMRAKGHWQLDERAREIADLTKLIELEPKNAEAFYSRGYAYSAMKEPRKALADFNETIRLNPKEPKYLRARASTYKDQGDFVSAIADYTKGIELEPANGFAYWIRGITHEANRDYAAAIADFTRAIELEPDKAGHYRSRGHAHAKVGNHLKAEADYTKFIQLNPSASSYYTRGLFYDVDVGDFSKAIADFSRAIELDPKDAGNYLMRGSAYRSRAYAGDAARADADRKKYEELRKR